MGMEHQAARYGTMEGGAARPDSVGPRASRMQRAMMLVVTAVMLLAFLAATTRGARRTVLDDAPIDPTADIPELNHPMGSQGGLPAEEPHTWVDEHGDGYDPEKQNALNDDDAFEVPFVGYAKKDLHWRQPAEPEQNVLDYLPTGKFSQPKSMELRNLLGPYPEPKNVWGGPGHEITLDY